MTYYMVFQTHSDEGLQIDEPCFDGCRVFITRTQDLAIFFRNTLREQFPESSYKVVPVEV